MRGLRLLIAATAVAALLAAPVSAETATPGDSVSGGGIRLGIVNPDSRVLYTVSVKGGPGGPIGSFLYRAITFDLTLGGRATCFDIAGNEAAIGGWITHSTDPALLGEAYLVFFEDNTPRPDVVSQTYILPADANAGNVVVPDGFPDTCPDVATTAHDAHDVHGNFVVRDR